MTLSERRAARREAVQSSTTSGQKFQQNVQNAIPKIDSALTTIQRISSNIGVPEVEQFFQQNIPKLETALATIQRISSNIGVPEVEQFHQQNIPKLETALTTLGQPRNNLIRFPYNTESRRDGDFIPSLKEALHVMDKSKGNVTANSNNTSYGYSSIISPSNYTNAISPYESLVSNSTANGTSKFTVNPIVKDKNPIINGKWQPTIIDTTKSVLIVAIILIMLISFALYIAVTRNTRRQKQADALAKNDGELGQSAKSDSFRSSSQSSIFSSALSSFSYKGFRG